MEQGARQVGEVWCCCRYQATRGLCTAGVTARRHDPLRFPVLSVTSTVLESCSCSSGGCFGKADLGVECESLHRRVCVPVLEDWQNVAFEYGLYV